MSKIELPQPIIGFRSWKIADGLLVPLFQRQGSTPWRPRSIAVARCNFNSTHSFHEGEPAYPGCTCGLYGHLAPNFVLTGNEIAGAFAAFGKVVVHSRGLRAGKARIVALLAKHDNKQANELAALYELPLFDGIDELREEAERWGEVREPDQGDDRFSPTAQARTILGLVNSGMISTSSARSWLGSSWPSMPVRTGRLASGFRSPTAQKAIGGPARSNHGARRAHHRVQVTLELASGVEVIQDMDEVTGAYRLRIKGLDSRWILRGWKESAHRVEMPLIGKAGEMSTVRGALHLVVYIESNFIQSDMGKALNDLRALGRIMQVDQSLVV